MSTQNGWLPIAKKLLMIFSSRAIKQPQRLTPHAEERPSELPNSEKMHARHVAVTVILCLLVLICYFCLFLCYTLASPAPSQHLTALNPFFFTCIVSRAQARVDCIHIDLGRYVTASHPSVR